MVEEIPVRSEGAKLAFAGAAAENVSFAYEEEEILKNCSVNIEKGKIIGIHGASGSGKSTFLRLFMRSGTYRREALRSQEKMYGQFPHRFFGTRRAL